MPDKKKTVALYLDFFGLREAPFKITPTTEFFYAGGQRGEILHALLYAIDVGEGIMSVTGEVGSGKTMLLRTLIEKLPDNADIIYIANPSLSGREILYNICEELGLQAAENRPDTVRLLQNHLVEQHTRGRRVIAFIDEAQAMPDESLEEIRLLSNFETSRDKLLQIVLFGQPEFEEKLRQQNMRQLRERITVSLKLKPFGSADVREYIATRLRAAGYNGAPLFSSDACRLIVVVSQGLSRRINVLADKAMLSAYERTSRTVDYADAQRAMKDVNFGKMRYRSEQSRRISKQLTLGVAAAACVLLAVAAFIRLYGHTEPSRFDGRTAETAAVEEAEAAAPAVASAGVLAAVGGASASDVARVIPSAPATVAVAQVAAPSVIVQVVTKTVSAPPPEEESPSPEQQRQEFLAFVSDVGQGKGDFDAEQLAADIAASAEAHADTPEEEGGAPSWQALSAPAAPAIANNERWSWMPASSYLRSRLNATQTWLQQNNGGYTARLITVSQERAVFIEKFLRYFSDFYSIRNAMVYPLRLESGDKFVVTFGVYATRADAEVFINNVPYYFTGGRPYAQALSVSLAEAQHAWEAQ